MPSLPIVIGASLVWSLWSSIVLESSCLLIDSAADAGGSTTRRQIGRPCAVASKNSSLTSSPQRVCLDSVSIDCRQESSHAAHQLPRRFNFRRPRRNLAVGHGHKAVFSHLPDYLSGKAVSALKNHRHQDRDELGCHLRSQRLPSAS